MKSPNSEEPELYLPPPESDRPTPPGINWEIVAQAIAEQVLTAWEEHLALLETLARVNLARQFMTRNPAGNVELDVEKFERCYQYLSNSTQETPDNPGEGHQ